MTRPISVLLLLCCCSTTTIAQHSDIFVYQRDNILITSDGGAERRVFSQLFDFFGHPFGNTSLPKAFNAENPGFQSNSSPTSGASVLPAGAILSGDFLPFRIPNGSQGNVLRWDLAAPMEFQPVPNGHFFNITDVSGDSTFEVLGDNQSVENVLLGLVGNSNGIHEHISWRLDDGDGNAATDPANGVYLMMMQLQMVGIESSEPFAILLNSTDVSVADQAEATAWATANLDSFAILGELPMGDFDNNGTLGLADIDLMVAAVAGQSNDVIFDLDGNGTIELADVDAWRLIAGQTNLASMSAYLPGDGNLDGIVDISDFNTWHSNRSTNFPAWSAGDFNADGVINTSDFNLWNTNKFQSAQGALAVPEPTGGIWGTILLAFLFSGRSRAKTKANGELQCVATI